MDDSGIDSDTTKCHTTTKEDNDQVTIQYYLLMYSTIEIEIKCFILISHCRILMKIAIQVIVP